MSNVIAVDVIIMEGTNVTRAEKYWKDIIDIIMEA